MVELEVAEQVAVEAGGLLLERMDQPLKISKKSRIDLVTDADLASQELIVRRLQENFPDHQVLAEEEEAELGSSAHKWIVDPLDGTTNYAHRYRFFCVSIALESHGKVKVGAVYDPVTRELFSAAGGQGAYLNGEAIRVSDVARLDEALLTTGFSYQNREITENLKLFNRMALRAQGLRRDGSAALDLCYVACGRSDGFWELSLHAWDVAAGKLIVEEAGGLVTGLNGSPCSIYDREILATNGVCHGVVMDALGGDSL